MSKKKTKAPALSEKSIVEPYRALMRSLLKEHMTPDTFSTAYLALYNEDFEALKALPRGVKRSLQQINSACEALQTPSHQRDRFEYGPDDLRAEVAQFLKA